ncbi:hypothetical protein, partial [Bradyrhizobium cenepequi]|uniref:hypothetical protein n=1 Tax=Bradyrhizobium cenepequi TaxID=2821403 RepID=UPI001CE2CDC4
WYDASTECERPAQIGSSLQAITPKQAYRPDTAAKPSDTYRPHCSDIEADSEMLLAAAAADHDGSSAT